MDVFHPNLCQVKEQSNQATMNIIIAGEEQRRPSFGLHAFLTKIPSPRRKQRSSNRSKIVDNDDDQSSRGHYCPYVSSPSNLSLESTPRKSRMTASVCSVSSTSSSASTKSTQSSRVRKTTLRSLFQRNSLTKSLHSKKNSCEENDEDDQVSLLLTALPLEQVSLADDNHSSMSSDWSHSWREDNFERSRDSGDSYESIMQNFETSQSTVDPDISLLFFSSSDDLCESPRRRRRLRQATVPRPHLQLEVVPKDESSSSELRPSSPRRITPPSPRRRRHTRKPARLRVRHAS